MRLIHAYFPVCMRHFCVTIPPSRLRQPPFTQGRLGTAKILAQSKKFSAVICVQYLSLFVKSYAKAFLYLSIQAEKPAEPRSLRVFCFYLPGVPSPLSLHIGRARGDTELFKRVLEVGVGIERAETDKRYAVAFGIRVRLFDGIIKRLVRA